MPTFYLETSALLKRYRSEKGTDLVEELFESKSKSDSLLTSRFTLVEVSSVLTRLRRAGTLSRQASEIVLRELAGDFQGPAYVLSVSDSTLDSATLLTQEYALRASDAVQLASALEVRDSGSGGAVFFVCSDGKLNNAASESALAVLDPEANESLETLRISRSDQ